VTILIAPLVSIRAKAKLKHQALEPDPFQIQDGQKIGYNEPSASARQMASLFYPNTAQAAQPVANTSKH
jgi:hypothetical protein